jgi:hypothetical protein
MDPRMSVQGLQAMIDAAAGEVGAGPGGGWYAEELFAAWRAARAESNVAYEHWCRRRGRDAYASFRAAEDRADAAEGALVRCMRGGEALPVPLAI